MNDLKSKNLLKKLLGATSKAIVEFKMLAPKDHVAVGISGGKDSLTLLYFLTELKRFKVFDFNLSAIYVNLGFEKNNDDCLSTIESYCKTLQVPYYVVNTSISDIVFEQRKESNPCSLCANMRRGALSRKCNEIGANKLALGHHKQDFVDTFFLSLIGENRLYSLRPVTYLDRTHITVIRPLVYVDECDIINITKQTNLPITKNPCPIDKTTKREEVRTLLDEFSLKIPSLRNSIFSAIMHPERSNLFSVDSPNKNLPQTTLKPKE